MWKELELGLVVTILGGTKSLGDNYDFSGDGTRIGNQLVFE